MGKNIVCVCLCTHICQTKKRQGKHKWVLNLYGLKTNMNDQCIFIVVVWSFRENE